MKQNEVPPNNEQPADKKDVGIESFVPQDSIKGKLRHLLSHTTEMHETTQAHGEAHRNTPPPMAEALQKPRSIADMPSPKHVSEEVLVESFGKQMLTQFKEVGGLYKQIWENPSLLKNALFELARDCVLFPRS